MNDRIQYDFGRIAALSGSINSGIGQLDNLLGELGSAIAPMQATWQGDGAASYEGTQQRWNSAFNELKGVGTQISVAAARANDNMQETELINRNRVAGS